jgi:very-long-chain (3R)-3-hydroxyacyl-CoA dehydratase
LVEVPRYAFYALSLVSTPGYAAKFVRYSLFLVLYPSGISGEVLSILAALPYIASRKLFAYPMPNALNFAFDYSAFCYFILATYVPGSYIMYNYMLTQRKKQLAPAPAQDKKQN